MSLPAYQPGQPTCGTCGKRSWEAVLGFHTTYKQVGFHIVHGWMRIEVEDMNMRYLRRTNELNNAMADSSHVNGNEH